MTSIDLAGLDNEGLFELLGTVHTEMASRERQHRKNLRDELENRQTAEGYKLADLFPQLARANAGRVPRRKLRAKFRNPHAPDDTWGNYIHDSTLWGGEVNGDRLNHPYGAVEGEARVYGTCDFEWTWTVFLASGDGVELSHVRNLCVLKCQAVLKWWGMDTRCYSLYENGNFASDAAKQALMK